MKVEFCLFILKKEICLRMFLSIFYIQVLDGLYGAVQFKSCLIIWEFLPYYSWSLGITNRTQMRGEKVQS